MFTSTKKIDGTVVDVVGEDDKEYRMYFERIKPLFDASGKGNASLERDIGIPEKKISQWNCKFTKSFTKYIPQIADYFCVSADYLMGRTEAPTQEGIKNPAPTDGDGLSELQKKVIEKIMASTDEELRIALGVLDTLNKELGK